MRRRRVLRLSRGLRITLRLRARIDRLRIALLRRVLLRPRIRGLRVLWLWPTVCRLCILRWSVRLVLLRRRVTLRLWLRILLRRTHLVRHDVLRPGVRGLAAGLASRLRRHIGLRRSILLRARIRGLSIPRWRIRLVLPLRPRVHRLPVLLLRTVFWSVPLLPGIAAEALPLSLLL